MIYSRNAFLFLLICTTIGGGNGASTEKANRLVCFKPLDVPSSCDRTFLEMYPELSRSSTNVTVADTFFHLFTRKNPTQPEALDKCGGKLAPNSNFNPAQPTRVIIHGTIEGPCLFLAFSEIKDELLKRADDNVIIIDWTWGNLQDNRQITNNADITGSQLAIVLKNIMDQTGISSESIHLIGHSLGCQVAALTGQKIQTSEGMRQESNSVKIGRITALDPRGSIYQNNPPDRRLDETDATIVDVIHTNAGKCFPPFFGYLEPCGHADFYVNGGTVQESCYTYLVESLFKGDIPYAIASLLPSLCFHLQSLQYFKVSINPGDCQFVGVKSDSYDMFQRNPKECGENGSMCAIMGMDFPEYYPKEQLAIVNQKFYLDTDLTCPYCNNSGILLEGFPPTILE